jgi:hypothetical protein
VTASSGQLLCGASRSVTRRYLKTEERSVAAIMAHGYTGLLRPFLAQRATDGGFDLQRLTAAEATDNRSPGTADADRTGRSVQLRNRKLAIDR